MPVAKRPPVVRTEQVHALTLDAPAQNTHAARWSMRDLPTKREARLRWRMVQEKIIDRLPTFRVPTFTEDETTSVRLSPVVVVSKSFSAAPCIGITGAF